MVNWIQQLENRNWGFAAPRVTDPGMASTKGSQGQIVFNTSDSKFYGCTVTGDPATWDALS